MKPYKEKPYSRHHTVIIGAGPSGLATAKYLHDLGIDYIVVERSKYIASAWHQLWDNFKLGMPAKELVMPAIEPFLKKYDPNYHLTRDEVIKLFETYASHYHLHMMLDTEVTALHQNGSEDFIVETSNRIIQARSIVMCIGPRQQPRFPKIIKSQSQNHQLIHSAWFKNIRNIPTGNTLVVGGGLSAMAIAKEIDQSTSHQLTLAHETTDREFISRNPQIDRFFLNQFLPGPLSTGAVKNYGRLKMITPTSLEFNGERVPAGMFKTIICATGYLRISILYAHLNGRNNFYRVGMEHHLEGHPVQTVNEGARQAEQVAWKIKKEIDQRAFRALLSNNKLTVIPTKYGSIKMAKGGIKIHTSLTTCHRFF